MLLDVVNVLDVYAWIAISWALLKSMTSRDHEALAANRLTVPLASQLIGPATQG